jgi:hypothetical protein
MSKIYGYNAFPIIIAPPGLKTPEIAIKKVAPDLRTFTEAINLS